MEFVTADPATHDALREAIAATVDALVRTAALPGPRSPLSTAQLAAAVAALDPCPSEGAPLEQVLERPRSRVLDGGLRLGDPRTRRAPASRAADRRRRRPSSRSALTNQSMDAFDASPAATFVEDALVGWLAREHGLGAHGSGVMTMGGTASNLLGLLLARDRAGERRPQPRPAAERLADRRLRGLARQHPPLAPRCSGSAPRP